MKSVITHHNIYGKNMKTVTFILPFVEDITYMAV